MFKFFVAAMLFSTSAFALSPEDTTLAKNIGTCQAIIVSYETVEYELSILLDDQADSMARVPLPYADVAVVKFSATLAKLTKDLLDNEISIRQSTLQKLYAATDLHFDRKAFEAIRLDAYNAENKKDHTISDLQIKTNWCDKYTNFIPTLDDQLRMYLEKTSPRITL